MNKVDLEILEQFLNYSNKTSDAIFSLFEALPNAICRGNNLKKFLYINGKRSNKVLLVAHADTVWDVNYENDYDGDKKLLNENGIIRNINGGLGADDRAGCAIVWLLKDMGHSILITNGEEQGRKGSSWLMSNNEDIADEINNNHQFMVQLDRRNATDFKCYSVGTDKFRSYISRKINYSEPDRSSFTDIVTLCKDICGVNLSVGYYNEHTYYEYLVLEEWNNTLIVCRKWLAEIKLPKFQLINQSA